MAEIHVTTAGVVAHNPGVAPAVKGAGQAITQVKDSSGKVTSTSGQVPGGSVVHNNPA